MDPERRRRGTLFRAANTAPIRANGIRACAPYGCWDRNGNRVPRLRRSEYNAPVYQAFAGG